MQRKYLLKPIEIEEWSLVDRPAINQGWLIVKRKGEAMKIEKIKGKIETAIKAVEEALNETDDAKLQSRLKLILGNLKSLLSVSKSDDDPDIDEVQDGNDDVQDTSDVQSDDDVSKAGRKIAASTQSELKRILDTLNSAAEKLKAIIESTSGYYAAPGNYGKGMTDEDLQKVQDAFDEIVSAYRDKLIDEDEFKAFSEALIKTLGGKQDG